jgi:hypothetical protein
VWLSIESSTGVADPWEIKRGISCPRQRNKSPGAPSFALFAKGGIPRISIPTVAYPILCQERKGPRISYCVALAMAACAAFYKESRMKFANATKPDRKIPGSAVEGSAVASISTRAYLD